MPAPMATARDGIRASASAPSSKTTQRASQAPDRSWKCHGEVGMVAFTLRSAAIRTSVAAETRNRRSAICCLRATSPLNRSRRRLRRMLLRGDDRGRFLVRGEVEDLRERVYARAVELAA